ncbi:MAG: ABC transporter substrate-binding protein [Firmicutes bacterium]|nr:ABC transporter substrate-binding protein [Bacillota bacterium]
MKKLILIAALMLVLGGCSSAEEELYLKTPLEKNETKTNDSESVQRKRLIGDGSITLSMRQPKTLNPLINSDYTVDNMMKLVFEPLFTLDETQRPVPDLAESYSLSSDGMTLEIRLKDGLKWHDGTDVTADDVIFSLDTIRESPSEIYKSSLGNVDGYKAVGKKTVIINYSAPYGACLYNLCFPIIPEHYYKDDLDEDSPRNFEPVGSGAYKFKSYRKVREIELEASPDYFKGEAGIKYVKIIIMNDKETDLYAFEQNITDAITIDVNEWGKFSTTSNIQAVTFNSNNFEFLGFNYNNPVFDNINIRHAIAHAIPRDEIIENIYVGNARSSIAPINPNSWLSAEDETAQYEYSLEKASEYVKASGIDTDRLKITLLVNSENKERVEAAKLIIKSLNQTGFEVTLLEKSYADYMQLLKDDNFELFMGGAVLSKTPDLRSLLLSSEQGEGGLNYFNFSEAQMDTLLHNAVNARSEGEFLTAEAEIQKYCSTQLPCIGIAFKDSILLTNTKIGGNIQPTVNNSFDNIEKWYLYEEEETTTEEVQGE